jgi:beta-galactosidase
MHHDLYRDLSRTGRLWVMEQQPGPVNWASWNPAPVDGAVRFWTLEAIAHGAEVVSYFRWRQAQWAQETYHTGLNRPDGTPDQASIEVEGLRDDLPKLAFADKNDASNGDTSNTVGLYFDWEAAFTYEALRQGDDQNAFGTTFAWYSFLRRMGLNVEFVSPSQMSVLPAYVVPCAPILDADVVDFIRDTGAPAVFCSRSGSRDGTLNWLPQPMVCEEGAPVEPLLEDLFLDRTETLRPSQRISVDLEGQEIGAKSWVEHLRVMGLPEPGSNEPPIEVVASFSPKPFEPKGLDAAIVRQGNIHYLGFEPDYDGMKAIMEPIFDKAMIPADELPEDIRIRRSDGRLYVMNFGPEDYDASALGLRGEAVIGEGTVVKPYTVSVFAD